MLGKHHHEWSTTDATSSSTSKPREQKKRGAPTSRATHGNDYVGYYCLAGASDARHGHPP
eukprot:7243019-Pyramimonas_sp.AAC.1